MSRRKLATLQALPETYRTALLPDGPQSTAEGRARVTAELVARGFVGRTISDTFPGTMGLAPNWWVVQQPDGRYLWSQHA